MAGMSAKKATSWGAICTLVCCLTCCAVPGVIAFVVLNNTIGEWPVVDGTVLSTRICDMGTSSSTSTSSSSSTTRQEPTYYATFNYTTLDGVTYTSETDYCLNPEPTIGKTKPITYDPNDPTTIVEESIFDIGLIASKTAMGIGFGIGALAFCVAVFMCSQPDPPASPETYQGNTNNSNNNNAYQQDAYIQNTNYNNAEYGQSSVPTSGPAGDIPTPMAGGPAGDIPTPFATAVPMTPAGVYNNPSATPASSGPVTYYK